MFCAAKRLDGYDNQLKSSLEGQGINWKVDYRQVPRSMAVGTTGGDPHITNKACQILKLLAYTTVDPSLVKIFKVFASFMKCFVRHLVLEISKYFLFMYKKTENLDWIFYF